MTGGARVNLTTAYTVTLTPVNMTAYGGDASHSHGTSSQVDTVTLTPLRPSEPDWRTSSQVDA